MATFYDLSETAQILFMAAQFIALCMGVYMVPMVLAKQKKLPKYLVILGTVICLVMLGIYSSNIRVQKTGISLPETTKWFSQQPVLFAASLLLLILAYMTYLLVGEYRRRKATITWFSIKEGLDSLSSGLCFYEPSGRIIHVTDSFGRLIIRQDVKCCGREPALKERFELRKRFIKDIGKLYKLSGPLPNKGVPKSC